ncbi:uncharacterized protein LOC126665133 [Mercurialis annua]|uniref:uncharacterized protein LOC126665133 n=1 Tax=Mercurialis annua TaxID=3986 RepID=UPI00215F9B05|nr:uncharacterized protein LOC126665133 [Mercurialis annua]
MMEPLPHINKVFSMVVQHERQLGLNLTNTDSQIFATKGINYNSCENNSVYESSVCYSRGNQNFCGNQNYNGGMNFGSKPRKFNYNQNKKPVCSFCGMEGHTVEICYRKHGFPPNFQSKFKRNNQGGPISANQVEMQQEEFFDDAGMENNQNGNECYGRKEKNEVCNRNHNFGNKSDQTDTNDCGGFPFTKEQYSKLISMIQQNGNNVAHVNHISAHFKQEEPTGSGSFEDDWIS